MTNIYIAIQFWLSLTNAGIGTFTAQESQPGYVQSIDKWTYAIEQPSIDWLTAHEHEAEAWWNGPRKTAIEVATATATVQGMSQTLQLSTSRLMSASVEFLPDEGPITTDDLGHKWISVADGLGDTMAVQISASPEVSKDVRKQRVADKITARKASAAAKKLVMDQIKANTNPSKAEKDRLLWEKAVAEAMAAP
jgi:hypothetical protein